MNDLFVLIHAGATLFLMGLIWTIQAVHYPLFANVGEGGYAEYQKLHMSRITYVVGPVMLAELVTAIYFIFTPYEPIDANFFRVGLALVLIIWGSTLIIQSPIHGRLAQSYDAHLLRKLVLTNWIRTALWTIRGGLVLWMIWLKIK